MDKFICIHNFSLNSLVQNLHLNRNCTGLWFFIWPSLIWEKKDENIENLLNPPQSSGTMTDCFIYSIYNVVTISIQPIEAASCSQRLSCCCFCFLNSREYCTFMCSGNIFYIMRAQDSILTG